MAFGLEMIKNPKSGYMKTVLLNVIAVLLLVAASPASAYQLQGTSNGACMKDGSACTVRCDNGQLAGTMYWNGSVWTDGVKSDPDMNAEAQKICAANGSTSKAPVRRLIVKLLKGKSRASV